MNSLSELEKKADILYSRALRHSKADHRGLVKCITCSAVMSWKEMECSHFKDRRYKALRYFDLNCQVSCPGCNRIHNDNQKPYKNWILMNLPAGTLTLLNKKKYEHVGSLDYRIMLNEIIKESKKILR